MPDDHPQRVRKQTRTIMDDYPEILVPMLPLAYRQHKSRPGGKRTVAKKEAVATPKKTTAKKITARTMKKVASIKKKTAATPKKKTSPKPSRAKKTPA